MFIWLALAAVALAWWARWHAGRRRMVALASQLPGPPVVPLLGNALRFMVPSEELSNVVYQLMQEYGDLWRFWLGPDLNVVVSAPDDVKSLLTNSKTSTKGPQYKYMADFLGEGILSGSGPTWRIRRKIALPNYGRRAVESYEEVFNREADQMLARLRGRTGEAFDIYDDVVTGTTYTVCQALMGLTRQQTLDLPNLDLIIRESHDLYLLVFMRMTKWYLQIEPLYRITKYYQQQIRFIKKIQEMVDVIVQHRLKVLEAMEDERKMELLKLEGDNEHNTELTVVDRLVLSNQISSYDEMLREIFTLFTSSQEATAKMASFLLLMMAYHPHYQEKVYQEIKSVFGDSDKDVSDVDIKQMTYLDMCFKEVLRLFPIGVMLQRTISDDIKISNATLPAGCSLVVPIFHMHRDKRYWANPNSFDPERFSPEQTKLRHGSCYIPFSLGPMDCMGRYFGTKLVKTMCVKILREFRLTSPESYNDMRLVLAISVASVNGYPVQLHRR
ncbi:cytochrome P450 4C1-like [Leguminivora glycinivorella]|uniref:cytochrome P450 4C1-like n=1 Tax=Leguminivora glycinivorella TaxID=1035111 RepID=UPI00200C4F7E|nr:cytochrome P450 4C1-like [Leguminivora glycinivorella]